MSTHPLIILAAVAAVLFGLARLQSSHGANWIAGVRDWLPIPLTLLAFREMEIFVPSQYNANYEHAWIRWDLLVLNHWHLKNVIESLGALVPGYLELCYLLIYGTGTFCIIVLWAKNERRQIDRFYVVLLTGTLLSYALFPYFPSRPPRLVFPQIASPINHDVFRRVNLFLLRNATIHTAVFPSAHVSSAFAAAWGMFLALPRRKRFGWGLLFYAFSVAMATIYGRYHYVADAVAGFGISLIAACLAIILSRTNSARNRHLSGRNPDLVA